MSTPLTKFYQLADDLPSKVHNLNVGGDQLKIALCASAHAPIATNAVLGDLTEIAYTYLSSRNVTISSASQTLGVWTLICADITLTATGGDAAPFRYIVLYNDTPTSPLKPLIGWYDNGSDITIQNGQNFTIDFDNVNGVLQIVLNT